MLLSFLEFSWSFKPITVSHRIGNWKLHSCCQYEPSERIVQGDSLCTWSYNSQHIKQVCLDVTSEGRPLDADIEVWDGPDNTSCKMRVCNDNGLEQPFIAILATPSACKTIAVRNRAQMEFPFVVDVSSNKYDVYSIGYNVTSHAIQGGALRTFHIDPLVCTVQVLLTTKGRPLNARIELFQGPNNRKQFIEIYTDDGARRPFFCILNVPNSGGVVRIVNIAPMEFPLASCVAPYNSN